MDRRQLRRHLQQERSAWTAARVRELRAPCRQAQHQRSVHAQDRLFWTGGDFPGQTGRESRAVIRDQSAWPGSRGSRRSRRDGVSRALRCFCRVAGIRPRLFAAGPFDRPRVADCVKLGHAHAARTRCSGTTVMTLLPGDGSRSASGEPVQPCGSCDAMPRFRRRGRSGAGTRRRDRRGRRRPARSR